MTRVALVLALLFVAASAAAQPQGSIPTNPASETKEAKPSRRLPRTAIALVAEGIAEGLEMGSNRALVVAEPLSSDAPATRGHELAASIAAHVAGRVGPSNTSLASPHSLAEAREKAHGEPSLVYLKIALANGKLRVTADVYPIPRTVWARLRDPEPGPVAHAFAEAPIDAEIRSFLPPIPLTAANVVRGQSFESDIVALACGDLDGDGSTEIVSVSLRRVTTLRLRDGKVLPLFSRAWTALSPLASAPLREPIGLAALLEKPSEDGTFSRFVDVGVTDRAKALRLDRELSIVASLSGLPVAAGDASGCVRAQTNQLSGPLVPCVVGDPAPSILPSGTFDALAAASLVTPRGETFHVLVSRDERGVATIRDDAGHLATIEGAGAQLAVGDLDQDGAPEILSALDVPSALNDAVVVRSWPRGVAGDAAKPREIMRLPAASGVHALAVCPPDGPGRAPFAVATADEIWVVR